MARRRRHGHRVPWGPYEPWPEPDGLPGEVDLDDPDQLDEGPSGHRPSAGGAGVREPRRPRPTLPGVAAAADDPEPDTFLDFSGPAESNAGIR